MVKISDILTIERIKKLESVEKEDVLSELCEMAASAPVVTSSKKLLQAIKQREAIMSTGIGMGIAIPHAKTSAVTDFTMAVGMSPNGVDFQSLDNLPVHLFILIVASDTQGDDFLKLFGRIGRYLIRAENKKFLLRSKTPKTILRHFLNIDKED